MQEEGKRPSSQPPPHEQLSPPAGTHPLSTPPSSLTTPFPLQKKKLLKVILKAPPSPNPSNIPSHSRPLSPTNSCPTLSAPLLPHHHHNLQQHQFHHHQQLLLQQQHLHKQRLLQQQTQQLASELQIKLQQQHLLQQEHPRLLEQFKQQLAQEQICTSSSLDSQSNVVSLWKQEISANPEQRQTIQAQEGLEEQEKGDDRRISKSKRRRDRSEFLSDVPPEERSVGQKLRHKSENADIPCRPYTLQEQAKGSYRENGREKTILQLQEDANMGGEQGSGRLKFSEEHLEGDRHANNFLKNNTVNHHLPVLGLQGSNAVAHEVQLVSRPRLSAGNGAAIASRHKVASSSSAVHSDAPRAATWGNAPTVCKPLSEGYGPADGAATVNSSKGLAEANSASIPEKKVLRGILDKLQKKDRYGAFSAPVDANEVPDYYDVIKEPMDFGTMRKRISSNFYTNLDLFEARAIKAAAETILDALRTPGSADGGILQQKVVGTESNAKKSHKKKKSWTSDFVMGSSANVGGRVGRGLSAAAVAESYFVDWQAGSGQNANKLMVDDRDDPTGYLAKSLGLGDERRWQLNEESRRSTYRQGRDIECNPLVNTVCGGSMQFVPAAFQSDFAYARSLARFAADLGQDVWKIAAEKIAKALPSGVPFGPGWVGQREAAGRSLASIPSKSFGHGGSGPLSRVEHASNKVGISSAQGVESFCAAECSTKAIDSKGAAGSTDHLPSTSDFGCGGKHGAFHGLKEGEGVNEMAPISQSVSSAMFNSNSATDVSQVGDVDGGGSHHKHLYSSAEASCGGTLTNNFEGEPILIPGRESDERHSLDYNSGQSSVLHPGSLSSIAPNDGANGRLDGGG
ncbi:hypothetical protein KP509_20G005700 [Ceratopteris richardii]|uniref:Bromo domain-containing protein n=1 Tax=Ceratopteris richardii TaxID=49495 RepID=A0A8T2SFY3_CERRI|nr:hypothetical protein KP509_20G005700 [Ceratopteris richardii]